MNRGADEGVRPAGAAQEDDILFHNLEVRPDRTYFIYIGELKAYGLNSFLIPCLEELCGRPVECIALVPDVMAHYWHPNLVVLNRESSRWHRRTGLVVNCRPSAGDFARQISESPWVRELLQRLLSQQDIVYLTMFESRREMTLPDGRRIRLLGPDPAVAHRFNDKIFQYRLACDLGIPVADGICCDSLQEAVAGAESFFRGGEEVFVSEAYSAAGSNSIFASCCDSIRRRFIRTDQPFLVTRRIPHAHDPTALAVVANSEEVYLASVADQKMEENHFRGSTFPTVLERETVERIKHYTRLLGRCMGAHGYRGIFGCDYMVDDRGQIYFVEVNARKQGTTLESTLTMASRLRGQPTLPEIEFRAFTEGKLPPNLTEMDSTEPGLCWGTYNVKCQENVVAIRGIPRLHTESELFHLVRTDPEYQAGAIVEDHLGAGVHQCAGGFVGRCISVGKTLTQVHRLLRQKELEVQSSIRPWSRGAGCTDSC